MIGIENFLGLGDLDFLPRSFLPGEDGEPLDVVAGDGIIGGHGRHAGKAAEFFERFFFYVVGHAGGFDFLLEIFGVALAFVLLAQFFLDGLHLLAQVILALRLLDAVLNFRLDLVAQLLHFELFGEMLIDFFEAHAHVGGFERVLLVGGGK